MRKAYWRLTKGSERTHDSARRRHWRATGAQPVKLKSCKRAEERRDHVGDEMAAGNSHIWHGSIHTSEADETTKASVHKLSVV